MNLKASEKNPKVESGNLEHKRLEAGAVGKFFGMGDHAARNIAGLVILILTIVIAVSFFVYNGDIRVLDFIKIVGPFITLGLGYLFGKNS